MIASACAERMRTPLARDRPARDAKGGPPCAGRPLRAVRQRRTQSLTIIFPTFSPRIMARNASKVFSRPSRTVSR